MTKRVVGMAALVLVLVLGACGSNDDPAVEAPPAKGEQGVVSVKDSSFSPPSVQVKAGQKVVWTFRDSFAHTATAQDGSFDSGRKANGETFEHTFATAGTFAYRCDIHPAMTATVTVT